MLLAFGDAAAKEEETVVDMNVETVMDEARVLSRRCLRDEAERDGGWKERQECNRDSCSTICNWRIDVRNVPVHICTLSIVK
jgi:hypothetical protein